MKSTARFIAAITSLCIGGLASSAMAQIEAGKISVNPHAGVHVFDGDQNLTTSGIYGLGLGYAITQRWGAEGVFDFSNPSIDVGSGDVNVFKYGLDGLYHFRPDQKLVPYLAAGVGGMTFDSDVASTTTKAQINGGGGVKYFITKAIALRGDARYLLSFDDTANNFLGTVGMTYVFGAGSSAAPAAAAAAAVVAVAPADRDGDGVNDDVDRCPDTPVGVIVDANGCPPDSDGDGVYDHLDQCPATPAGDPVDATGCPPDSDGDGVLDSEDKCPGTPRGAKVDARGCWVLDNVQFDTSKATLKPDSNATLNEALDVLRQNPDLRVEIQGYTDNTGSTTFNRSLSEKRAQAVLEFFASQGVARDRLSAAGYGPDHPIATNDTREGRAANRRVELKPIR